LVGLPSFFNKTDFFGKLLPGYVAVILYIVFFKPDLLIGTNSLSIDIFTAVVFVIAGPLQDILCGNSTGVFIQYVLC